MAFTEFCCRSGGSNLNAGTRTGNSTEPGTAADFTYASGTWSSATGVFTPASGNPSTDGVSVGDFASVYADGASVTTLIGRVTAVSSTTITVSTTVRVGTTTDGTTNRTLKIGGAWAGPSGSVTWPFSGLNLSLMTNVGGLPPRINLKNNQTYSITTGLSFSSTTRECRVQGYAISYGDGEYSSINGGSSGAAYTLLTITGNYGVLENIEFANNGATSEASAVSGGGNKALRCYVHDVRGSGFLNFGTMIECETYNCNQSNTSRRAGFWAATGPVATIYVRCISHDNSGSNSSGFLAWSTAAYFYCIADTNGQHGFMLDNAANCSCFNCDAYNNSGSGFREDQGSYNGVFESCNSIKNGAAGLTLSTSVVSTSSLINCGFGAGTQANASGQTLNATDAVISGNVTYANDVTPWTDPANGDFRISLAAAKGAGRGTYTQTAASYAGTVGYPDIGAAQSTGGGGGIPVARGMHGGMR